jgi:HSP20 family protein
MSTVSIVRFDPFRDITSFRNDLNRLFAGTLGGTTTGTQTWAPAVDVFETKDAVTLKAELPGLSVEDVSVEVDDNILTISGERVLKDKVEDGHYYRLERSYGRFSRSLTLPQGIKADEVAATFLDGVLEVTVPKADEVKPRKVAIAAGGAA